MPIRSQKAVSVKKNPVAAGKLSRFSLVLPTPRIADSLIWTQVAEINR
jgi:hypothetical protein